MLTVDFDRLGIGPATKMIDVGCGAGRHAFEAYRRGADVIAFDRDASELESVDAILKAMAETGEAPATASATSTPAPLPTAPVEAAPVDPGPAVTLSSAEVATLNAAISAGKAVLADAVQDLTNPAPGQTFIQTLEAQAIGEAETVGTVAVTEVGELAKGLLQPIAKPPTAN